MTNKPSYEELARAFWEYLAETNNFSEGVAPSEEEVERARSILKRTGVKNDYEPFG